MKQLESFLSIRRVEFVIETFPVLYDFTSKLYQTFKKVIPSFINTFRKDKKNEYFSSVFMRPKLPSY